MKINSRGIQLMLVMLSFLLNFIACSPTPNELSTNENPYKIASPDYAVLAEKTLNFLADFEFDSFASMLADDVEYEFPDGKKIVGKTTLIDYWKNYKSISGLESMKILSANYLPIAAHLKPNGVGIESVKVITDFTNKLTFSKKEISIKMNFSFHFNDAKMIDKIITNYDLSKIK
jgi:hypothetical protein